MGPNNGKVAHLDRHNVQCDDNQVLSQFKINVENGEWQYKYGCVPTNKTLQCRGVETDFNDDGGNMGKTAFLDRHVIKCNPDEALNQFRLIRNPDNTQVKYTYKCCK
jgi:hypothetical protein